MSLFKNKTVRWHRRQLNARRTGEVGSLELDGQTVQCAFPLVVSVAGKTWAIAVPIAQLRQTEVDVYVFEATKDKKAYALTPAPEEGFDELKKKLGVVEEISAPS